MFSRFSSTLVAKFGRKSLTPGDNIFVMSSSSFDCNLSPDAWTLGLWDSFHLDDDELCCSLFDIQQQPSTSDASCSVTRTFLAKPGICNLSSDAWHGFSWLGSSDCGTLCGRSLDDPTPSEMQPVARCLAWIYLNLGHRIASFLDQRSTASSCHVALQPARELFCLQAFTLTTRL